MWIYIWDQADVPNTIAKSDRVQVFFGEWLDVLDFPASSWRYTEKVREQYKWKATFLFYGHTGVNQITFTQPNSNLPFSDILTFTDANIGDGDATDFRVTEAQQKRATGLVV